MIQSNGDTALLGRMTNPAIKRMEKVAETERSSESATYAGVVTKTIYFLILTVVGIVLYSALQGVIMGISPDSVIDLSTDTVFDIQTNLPGVLIILAVTGITIVTALLSIFVRAIVPVTGTIYVLAEGYLLAFITDSLSSQYEWLGLVALLMTVIIVFSLMALYCRGKIRVNQKFRAIVTTIFVSVIVGGFALFAISFIPGLSRISNSINMIASNPAASIAFSLIFIVIACLFLISDFDAIHQLVENKLPKKYEWCCAFGVAYTVLYLYVKILEILIKVFSRR